MRFTSSYLTIIFPHLLTENLCFSFLRKCSKIKVEKLKQYLIIKIKIMSDISQNNSGGLIAGAIILGAIIIGLFIYLGLRYNTGSSLRSNDSVKDTVERLNKVDTGDYNKTATTNISDSSDKDNVSVSGKKLDDNRINNTSTTESQSNPPTVSIEEAIKQELLQKTAIPEDKLVFEIAENTGKIARGAVKNKDSQVGGAGWFAAKNQNTQNKWRVTYVGQGVPECSEVNPYNYPTSWADYCLNTQGKTVKR